MDLSAVAPDHPAADSGRRYPRYPAHLPISAAVAEEAAPGEAGGGPRLHAVSLQDISLTGFYFTSPRAYAVDSQIDMRVTLAGQDYRIRAMVQRSKEGGDGAGEAHETAVLFVRGGDVLLFLAAVAAFLHRRPHAEDAAGGAAAERV